MIKNYDEMYVLFLLTRQDQNVKSEDKIILN